MKIKPTQGSLRLFRLGILSLQIIAISVLLWASSESEAKVVPPTNKCFVEQGTLEKICRPVMHNESKIPAHYIENPPEKGFVARINGRHGEPDRFVWVPGITDNMTKENREKFFRIKNETPGGKYWEHTRKSIAEIILLQQENKDMRCTDNMHAMENGQMRLTCRFTAANGEQIQKSYANVGSHQLNKHFNAMTETPQELIRQEMGPIASGKRNPNSFSLEKTSRESLSSVADKKQAGFSESSDSKQTSRSIRKKKRGGKPGFTQAIRGDGFNNYIQRHIASRKKLALRKQRGLFSKGDEEVIEESQVAEEGQPGLSPSKSIETKEEKKNP